MKEKISTGPDTTAQDIALKMISSGLAAIPVVNEDHDLLGLVTEHAILAAIHQGLDLEQVTAGTVMIKPPITAEVSTPPEELIQLMLQHSCCSVITLVNNGKYAGVISRHMLMDIYTSPYYARFAQKDRKAPFVCL